jgi:nitroimidazol reductase NimA-like FMN-containing flavoprotein (pyridoxamine 5'-phosphate oxidase superfamily)
MGTSEGSQDRAGLDHQGLEVIDVDECWELLGSQPVGRVAFVDAGEPMVLPVNHAVVGRRVVFRTRPGTLLHEALMREPVAFQVDDFDVARRSGWSVLVRGVADLAEDPDTLWATELDAWADGVERDDWVEIRAEEISGRRIVHHHG